MASRFRIGRRRALDDGRLVRERVESLAEGDDLDPVAVMGMERAEPYARRPTAPYRLDLALTYRLPAGQAVSARARRRVTRELKTERWFEVLDQAWSIGIPHVVFVGGEPTLRRDLPALVAHAEGLGQVSGVVTAGERLTTPRRLDDLAAAGLDHLLVVIDPHRPRSLLGLRRAVASDIFCAAHWTLDPKAVRAIPAGLRKVRDTGVTHVSLSAPSKQGHEKVLAAARQALAEAGLILVWDLPVPFSSANPVRLESGLAPEAGAWLYVEPDGDVLRSIEAGEVLGNITRDPIAEIWTRAGGAEAGSKD
jgi:MoaA/NifB/PqqE/SkfB family radical SAM enzyme